MPKFILANFCAIYAALTGPCALLIENKDKDNGAPGKTKFRGWEIGKFRKSFCLYNEVNNSVYKAVLGIFHYFTRDFLNFLRKELLRNQSPKPCNISAEYV